MGSVRLNSRHTMMMNTKNNLIDVACTFQSTIGGKFAPLIGLSDEDMDMDTMITTYNTAVTDAAGEILGKERRRKSHGSPKMFSTSVMRGEI